MLNKKLDRLTYSWNSTRGSGMHHQTRMKHFAEEKLKEMLDMEKEMLYQASQTPAKRLMTPALASRPDSVRRS
jgi:hypothetical protein